MQNIIELYCSVDDFMKKNWGNRTYYLLSQGKQRIQDSQLSPVKSWQS